MAVRLRFFIVFTVAFILATLAIQAGSGMVFAQDSSAEPPWRHGTALTGEPKYPADFPHFDYVNPDAPKGGTLRLSATGSFDTLHPVLPRGQPAVGLGLVYETLMTPSLDEIDAEYGLLAEAMRYPDDYGWVEYRLREGATWHDGEAVTVDDVVWSFDTLTEINPNLGFYYQHVVSAEAVDDRVVRFTFDQTGNKELPKIVGQLLIMPRHWWTGTDAAGNPRDIAATTLEPPLGSGPYRITGVNPGSTVTFERVADYWGADLPVNIGKENFDEIRYIYFLDRDVEFQAFLADEFDFWRENQARRWAEAYDVPAVEDGRIVREILENEDRDNGEMTAFIPNLRRDKFSDPRVRRALNLAFDYETLNETIFYGLYERIDSYFFGSPLAHAGAPEGRELEILEEVRDLVPASVFQGEYENPIAGDQQALRANLRQAIGLFREAGYEVRDGQMVNAETGEPFTIELINGQPSLERIFLPYAEDLRQIGVELVVRTVDRSQFIERVRNRDFDMMYSGWRQSLSPGNEQFDFFGSEAADRPASRNYGGIADAGVDALIEKIVFAADRQTLEAATRAFDRVLMHNDFVIPSYVLRETWIAYWNRFSHPDPLPYYSIGFPSVWWYDANKAEAIQ